MQFRAVNYQNKQNFLWVLKKCKNGSLLEPAELPSRRRISGDSFKRPHEETNCRERLYSLISDYSSADEAYKTLLQTITQNETHKEPLLGLICQCTRDAIGVNEYQSWFKLFARCFIACKNKDFILEVFEEAGLIRFSLMLLQDSISFNVQEPALVFLCILLRTSQAAVQKLLLVHFSSPKVALQLFGYFQKTFYSTTRLLLKTARLDWPHVVIRLSRVLLVLQFLGLCCDNCNHPLQNYMRTQTGACINLVTAVFEMLGKLTQDVERM